MCEPRRLVPCWKAPEWLMQYYRVFWSFRLAKFFSASSFLPDSAGIRPVHAQPNWRADHEALDEWWKFCGIPRGSWGTSGPRLPNTFLARIKMLECGHRSWLWSCLHTNLGVQLPHFAQMYFSIRRERAEEEMGVLNQLGVPANANKGDSDEED